MAVCTVCGTALKGNQGKFCSPKCKRKDQTVREKNVRDNEPYKPDTTPGGADYRPDGRSLTMAQRQRVIDAFLTHPEWEGKWAQVSKFTGINPDTIKNAYNNGWPRENIPPIREMLQEVKARARQRRAEDVFDQRMELTEKIVQSVDYAVAVRTEQGEILDSIRSTVKEGLLPELKQFVEQSQKLRELATKAITDEISLYGTDPDKSGLGHVLDLQKQSILNFETGMKAVEKLFAAHKMYMGDVKEASEVQSRYDEAREWTLEELKAHRAMIDGIIANMEAQGEVGIPMMPDEGDLIGERVHASQLN